MLEQQEPDPAISSSMFLARLTFASVFSTMPRMCFLDQAEVLTRCMAAAGELHDISCGCRPGRMASIASDCRG